MSIFDPMPWYIAGPLISLGMLLLIYFGKSFGLSSNFRAFCTILGAGRRISFFQIPWKKEIWNITILLGVAVGGLLSAVFLNGNHAPEISEATLNSLQSLGMQKPSSILPAEIFNGGSLFSILTLTLSGIIIGFGTRYAGGCTSGHAISGLSALQLPSLIAVIGFFIGGLVGTHFILPLLF